jgi:hypothetical protein
MALCVAALNGLADANKPKMTHGWQRGFADAVVVGLVVLVGVYCSRAWKVADAELSDISRIPLKPGFGLTFGLAGLVVTAALYGPSAGWMRALAFGASVGVIIWAGLHFARHCQDKDAASRPADSVYRPLWIAIAVTSVTGFLAGFAYAALYGVLAGLGGLYRQSVMKRSTPSAGLKVSKGGLSGGVALGCLLTLATHFAQVELTWSVIIGCLGGLAAAVAFGTSGTTLGTHEAPSPKSVLARDRMAFLALTSIVAITSGAGVGAEAVAQGRSWPHGLLAALIIGVIWGLPSGAMVATGQSRWALYVIYRTILSFRGELPWRLMTFLDDAHRYHRILRQNGALYSFRHRELQSYLATQSML